MATRLGVKPADLLSFQVFRRGWDARKKSAIQLVYTIDAEVRDEPAVMARLKDDNHIGPTPDTSYHPLAHAPPSLQKRPVVIGTGPCGFMCALVLAQMGFRPIILERGRIVRERTKDTWGLWRRGVLDPEFERAVRRGRRRHVLRRQALQPDPRSAPSRPQGADRVRQGRRAG